MQILHSDQTKKNKMGRACITHRNIGNAYKVLVDKREGRDILKDLVCGREDFIKVDLTEKV